MINNIKLNFNKNIGTVIFIVEGDRGEINLLKHLLNTILNYKLYIKKRGKEKIEIIESKCNKTFQVEGNNPDEIEYFELKKKNNTIFIINSKTSNIGSIKDDNLHIIDEIIEKVKFDYNINIDNSYIYYIFDRDVKSNKKEVVEKLVNIYTSSTQPSCINSNDGIFDSNGGMLLLSYPSIESFVISNFKNQSYNIEESLGKRLKTYINDKKFQQNKICIKSLKKSLLEMFNGLNNLDVINLDNEYFYEDFLDNIDLINKETFYKQESVYSEKNKYKALSLLNVALLDLGILEYVQ